MRQAKEDSAEMQQNGYEREDMPTKTVQPQQNARLTGKVMESDEGETEEQD